MTRREMAGWGLLGMVLGTAATAKGKSSTSDLEEACRKEVLGLHQFFEDWFNGVLDADDASFERFAEVIDEDFVIISPSSRMTAREPLLGGLRGAHGSWKASEDGKIWIENFRLHRHLEDFAVVTYEEWQRHEGEVRARLSTAFFGRREETPNGVAWLHLHEVWMAE